MFACTWKNEKALTLLASKQAKMQDGEGNTALMYAAQVGFLQGVKALLEEAKMRNKQQKTALMTAAFMGHEQIVRLLAKHESSM